MKIIFIASENSVMPQQYNTFPHLEVFCYCCVTVTFPMQGPSIIMWLVVSTGISRVTLLSPLPAHQQSQKSNQYQFLTVTRLHCTQDPDGQAQPCLTPLVALLFGYPNKLRTSKRQSRDIINHLNLVISFTCVFLLFPVIRLSVSQLPQIFLCF